MMKKRVSLLIISILLIEIFTSCKVATKNVSNTNYSAYSDNMVELTAYAGAKQRRDRLNPTPWSENTDTPAAKSDNLFI